jgi:hypothetical protein
MGPRPCSTTAWFQTGVACPYSEGVVVKDNNDLTGAAWYKVKQSDLADFEMVQVLPGNGGKFATSAGAIEVMQKTPAGAPARRPVRRFRSRQEPIQRSHRCHADGLTGRPGRESRGIGRTRPCDECLDPSRDRRIPVRSNASSCMPMLPRRECGHSEALEPSGAVRKRCVHSTSIQASLRATRRRTIVNHRRERTAAGRAARAC